MKVKLAKPQTGRGWSISSKSVPSITTLHMSVTKNGEFPSPRVIRRVVDDFNAKDFERDDHSVKIASLWLPLNKDKRGECECK